jgi:phosphopantothenate-cysteine ligase
VDSNPKHRRKYTSSGLEHMMGTADRFKDSEKQPNDRPLLEFGSGMEIESLIIPAVEGMHTRHIESNNTMMNSALHRGGGF